jgi:hypothetical protein
MFVERLGFCNQGAVAGQSRQAQKKNRDNGNLRGARPATPVGVTDTRVEYPLAWAPPHCQKCSGMPRVMAGLNQVAERARPLD